MPRFVELSHEIVAGMKTYPGLPEPRVEVLLDYEASRERYQNQAGGAFDFSGARSALERLNGDLDAFYRQAEELAGRAVSDQDALRACAAIRRLARILVPLNFTRDGRFRHDPAVPIPPLPDLAPATDLGRHPAGSHEARVVQSSLLRGVNRFIAGVEQARAVLPGGGRG